MSLPPQCHVAGGPRPTPLDAAELSLLEWSGRFQWILFVLVVIGVGFGAMKTISVVRSPSWACQPEEVKMVVQQAADVQTIIENGKKLEKGMIGQVDLAQLLSALVYTTETDVSLKRLEIRTPILPADSKRDVVATGRDVFLVFQGDEKNSTAAIASYTSKACAVYKEVANSTLSLAMTKKEMSSTGRPEDVEMEAKGHAEPPILP